MKKFIICLILCFIVSSNGLAQASPHTSSCRNGHYHNNHHYRNSSSSSHVYLVRKEFDEREEKFANCDKHVLLTETTTNYYSDGTKRIYKYYTVFNADGTTLISSATDIKHLIYKDNHYFLIRKNKNYKIVNDNGIEISHKKYTSITEIAPNKLLVKYEKKYGIIDLTEKIIVPIKYKKFEDIGNNLYLTNLNGYFGMMDISNNILIKNEYDNIKPIHNSFLLKKYGKYGLVNSFGKIILPAEYDKIKKLGEYIIVKKDKYFGILDADANWIDETKYKKIKLDRNILYGQLNNKTWQVIPVNTKLSPFF